MENDILYFNVKVGEPIHITVKSVPGAGYVWNVNSLPEGVQMESKRVKQEGDLVGSTLTEVFSFTANKSGSYTFNMVYNRPWLKEIKETKTINLIVGD